MARVTAVRRATFILAIAVALLSALAGGAGPARAAEEAARMVELARAFFFAGAPSRVVSH